MPKGISRAEAMSNSEKIKPKALAVIELHLSEGISQSIDSIFYIPGIGVQAYQHRSIPALHVVK